VSIDDRRNLKRIPTLYLPLLVFLVYTLFPIYWTVNTAFKRERDIMTFPLQYFPGKVTLENFVQLWKSFEIYRYMLNSLLVAVASSFLILFMSTLAGFSFARFKFKGKRLIMLIFLSVQMFPVVLLIVPLYIIYSKIGLIDTLASLIITYGTFNLAFCTLTMRGFFLEVPREIEECAMVDGCSRMAAIVRVTLPVVVPGLVATGLFAFLSAWNELMFAVMFLSSQAKMTLPIALATFIGQYQIYWGPMCAGVLTALLPELLLFAYIQKYLIRGLASGAVKG
jgi:multiple sugar transport system permease protein